MCFSLDEHYILIETITPGPLKCLYSMTTHSNQMQLSIRCTSAPWENETTDIDRAIDIAYSLSEEYSCDVQLIYTSTGTIHSVVSNY